MSWNLKAFPIKANKILREFPTLWLHMGKFIKTEELHFVLNICMRSTHVMPQRGRNRSSEGVKAEEYVVLKIISSDLDDSYAFTGGETAFRGRVMRPCAWNSTEWRFSPLIYQYDHMLMFTASYTSRWSAQHGNHGNIILIYLWLCLHRLSFIS